MGLYGSPDLSNKHEDKEEFKRFNNKKPDWIKWLALVTGIINVFILINVEVDRENLIALLTLDSIIIFAISVITMIYNLIKKRNIRYSIAVMLLSIGLFLLSVTALADVPSKEIGNNDARTPKEKIIDDKTERDEIGTRKNPARIGDIMQGRITDARGLDCLIELELLEVKKKEEANEMAKEIYTFVTLEENQEYLFAKFRLKNTKNNSNLDLPFNFNWSVFSYATSDYRKYDYNIGLASGGELLESVDLYEGAEQEGWICFYVEKDDQQPKAVFLENTWFDL